VAEERQDFLRLLCRLRGRAVLSFSCRSLVDDRETFASPVILGAFRLLSAQPRGDYEGLRKWLQEPASFAPVTETECLDAAEWWLCRGADRPRVANFAELVAASFANLRRGRAAAAVRAADEFSIFDGRIAAPDARLDPAAPQGPVVSATSLQTLGACPLRYFYRYVLELEPPEPLAPDATRWLDPRQFGQLLHEVLYDLVGGLVADGHWPPDPTRDEPRLRETLERALRRWEEEHPPPGEDAYRRRVEELERSLGAFLRTPPHWEGSQPLYLETSIGLRPQGRGCELDSPDPAEVRLPDGRTIRVRARLDRIDRVGDGRPPTFVVIDYKSGRLSAEHDEADPFRQGRLLQQALYLAVARDALGRRFGQDAAVEGFGFLFAGPNGHGRTIPCGARVIDEGLNRAARLCALAAGGAFPATSDSNDCRLCDFRAACTAVSPDLGALCARSARKIADARNEIVRPFAELRNAC
jgi:ATP-dependent helicase/nuclease subunit B